MEKKPFEIEFTNPGYGPFDDDVAWWFHDARDAMIKNGDPPTVESLAKYIQPAAIEHYKARVVPN